MSPPTTTTPPSWASATPISTPSIARILSDLAGDPADIPELLALALDTGTLNLKVMELLDAANTGTYGTPEPTVVRMTPRDRQGDPGQRP